MRSLLVVTLLLAAGLPADLCAQAAATSQAPTPVTTRTPDGTQPWDKIQGLMAGTKIHIKLKTGVKVECRTTTVSAAAVTCDSTASFKRVDIDSIRSNHRVRSTLIGLGAGYFGAGGLGAAIASSNHDCGLSAPCLLTIAVVVLTVAIVTPIVFHIMDLTATTLYKGP